MISKITIDEIVALIRRHDLFFFVGAGISIAKPSFLLTFRELQNKMIWALCHDFEPLLKNNYRPIYDAIDADKYNDPTVIKFLNIPPEYLFEICNKEIVGTNNSEKYLALEPLNAFRGGLPNRNHRILVNLLLRSFTPAIFTTNFDLLFERAIEDASSKIGKNITRCWRIEQFITVNTDTPTLFKLHGSVDDSESVVISLDEIGKRAATAKLKSFQHFLENYYIFFCGYRGADIDIFSYLASTKCKGIIWNAHNENRIIPKIKMLLDAQDGSLIVGDLGHILEQLSENLNLGVPILDNDNSKDRSDVLATYYKSFIGWAGKVDHSSKLAIVGDLWEYVGEGAKAMQYFNAGLELSVTSIDMNTHNTFLQKLANVCYKLRNYRGAKELCSILLYNADSLAPALRLYQYINTLQLMGLIESKDDIKKGAMLLTQSLGYQEQLEKIDPKSRYLKSDILLNIATMFHKAHLLDEALGYYKSALTIYDEFGDIHGRAKILENIGSIFMQKDRYDDCIDLYGDSEYLLNETGDIPNLAKIHLNLARAYHKLGMLDKSKEYAKSASRYYKMLSDKQNFDLALKFLTD